MSGNGLDLILTEIRALRDGQERFSTELSGLRGEQQRFSVELSGLRGELDGLRGELGGLRGEQARFSTELTALRREQDRLRTSLVEQMERLLNEQGAVRDDMSVLRAIIDRVDGTTQRAVAEIRAMHSQFARLTNRVDVLETKSP